MKLVRALVTLIAAAAVALVLAVGVPAGASTGTQRFLLLSNDPSSSPSIVIANGPIHAKGSDQQVSPSIDRFVFPMGTVRIHHKTTSGTSKDTFDKQTCYGTHTEQGTFTIVRGTGAYKGATGSGTYRLKVAFVGCDQSATPEYFSEEIRAVGTIDF